MDNEYETDENYRKGYDIGYSKGRKCRKIFLKLPIPLKLTVIATVRHVILPTINIIMFMIVATYMSIHGLFDMGKLLLGHKNH